MFYSGIENPSSPGAILRSSPGHPIPIKRVSMKTRRFAGLAIQEDPSRFPTPSQAVLGLYPELLRALPVGIVLLLLEDPSDAESFRIVDANRPAAEITTPNSPNLLGTSLTDFPRLLETAIPGQLLATLRGGVTLKPGESFLWS